MQREKSEKRISEVYDRRLKITTTETIFTKENRMNLLKSDKK